MKDQHPLVVGLFQGGNSGAHQVLSQEHTEHGRLRRVFHALPGDMYPCVSRAGRKEKAKIPCFSPQRKNQHIPFRLLYLVYFGALQLFPKLPAEGGYGDCVKRHVMFPP